MFRTSIPGPISSVTSNFNIPKVISHGAPTPGLGRVLYRTCLNIAFINLLIQLQFQPVLSKHETMNLLPRTILFFDF